jgi:hypothetical protein
MYLVVFVLVHLLLQLASELECMQTRNLVAPDSVRFLKTDAQSNKSQIQFEYSSISKQTDSLSTTEMFT